ncbi:MAG TPA: hypothetical protein VKU38_08325 [Ktedonobacteraceae bacterium]|nr:hypothetical protein [Ktedonobacteraceae bacterium]
MATNTHLWLTTNRLRDKIALHGYAMPIFMGFVCPVGGCIVFCDSPLFAGAESCSVPISRGSPPTPD